MITKPMEIMMLKKQIILVAPPIWHDTLKQSLGEADIASSDTMVVVDNVYYLTAIVAETYLPEKTTVTVCIMVDYLDVIEMEIFKTLQIYDHIFMIAIASSGITMCPKLLHAKNNGAHKTICLDNDGSLAVLTEISTTPLKLPPTDNMITKNHVHTPVGADTETTPHEIENKQVGHLDFETLETKLVDEMPADINRTDYNKMEITDLELDALLGPEQPDTDDQS